MNVVKSVLDFERAETKLKEGLIDFVDRVEKTFLEAHNRMVPRNLWDYGFSNYLKNGEPISFQWTSKGISFMVTVLGEWEGWEDNYYLMIEYEWYDLTPEEIATIIVSRI